MAEALRMASEEGTLCAHICVCILKAVRGWQVGTSDLSIVAASW